MSLTQLVDFSTEPLAFHNDVTFDSMSFKFTIYNNTEFSITVANSVLQLSNVELAWLNFEGSTARIKTVNCTVNISNMVLWKMYRGLLSDDSSVINASNIMSFGNNDVAIFFQKGNGQFTLKGASFQTGLYFSEGPVNVSISDIYCNVCNKLYL